MATHEVIVHDELQDCPYLPDRLACMPLRLQLSRLKPDAFDALKRLAAIMDSPSASRLNIFVAGHTDNIPISKPETLRRHPNNLYLSLHRAVEVQKVLVDAGVAPGRIGVMGFGEHHPVEPNAGKGGNVANRRVEIWLVAPDKFLTTP